MKNSAARYLILVPGTIWGISFIVVELILPVVPPLTLTLIRNMISVVVLLLLLWVVGFNLPRTGREWLPFFALSAVNLTLPFALTSWSQLYIEGGLASILLSSQPLFAVTLAFFFTDDEDLNFWKLFGVLLGFSGIVALIGPSVLSGLGANLWAQLGVVASAMMYGIGAVFLRHVYTLQPHGLTAWQLRLRITTAQFMAAVVMLLPFSLWIDQPWLIRPTFDIWLYLLFLGIGVTLMATLVYFYLIEQMGAGPASSTIYLIPVAGVITGILVLGERLTGLRILALVLILCGVFIVSRSSKGKKSG